VTDYTVGDYAYVRGPQLRNRPTPWWRVRIVSAAYDKKCDQVFYGVVLTTSRARSYAETILVRADALRPVDAIERLASLAEDL
jgi:hypothetical protein